MNRSILSLACAVMLGWGTVASAQITGGPKAGLNLATETYRQLGVTGSENRQGLVAGGFLEVPLARHVAFQPEVLFDMRSSQSSLNEPGFSAETVVRLTSLDFPVLLRVDLPVAGRVVPYAYAGPSIAFLLSANARTVWNGGVRNDDFKSELRTTELNVAVGGGVRFGRIMAEARYTRGLTNAMARQFAAGPTMTTSAILVIGGARF